MYLPFALDLFKLYTVIFTAECQRAAGYGSGGVNKDKEPLKKAKTPQGRFDMDENESNFKDVLESRSTQNLCYTVIYNYSITCMKRVKIACAHKLLLVLSCYKICTQLHLKLTNFLLSLNNISFLPKQDFQMM